MNQPQNQLLRNPLRAAAWWWVKRWVQRQFPAVPSLSTQSLANWLGDRHSSPSISPPSSTLSSPPVLLDVRRQEEFTVSHLPGAHWAPDLEAALALELDPQQPVVLYCSVGYRSARLGEQLRQAGYSQVYNLAGSAFEWANEGRSLVSGGQPASVVHPYSALWGLLLRPDRRSSRPPAAP